MRPQAWTVNDQVGENAWQRKDVFVGTHDSACREWLVRDRAHPGRPKLVDPRGEDRSTEARVRMTKFAQEQHLAMIAQANKPREGQQ